MVLRRAKLPRVRIPVPEIVEMLAQAKALHRVGQLPDAAGLYRAVLARDAEHVEASYLLGAASHALGRVDEAIIHLGQAMRLRPDHVETQHHLGVVLAEVGLFDDAIVCLERAARLRPASAELAGNLQRTKAAREEKQGSIAVAAGRMSEAEGAFRRALELFPDYAEAHNGLGAILEKQGQLAAAARIVSGRSRLKPELAAARYNLGAILEQQGQSLEAVRCYERALELMPELALAHNNLGVLWEKQGLLEEAAACCRRATELAPDLAEAHNNLAIVLARQGDSDGAIEHCRRAVQLKPDYADAHNNLGTALVKVGRRDEATAAFRRAVELKPDYAAACCNLAAVLSDRDQLDEALACCRRALELNPRAAEAHGNLGMILAKLGLLDDAVAADTRALELDPESAELHNQLGVAYFSRDESDLAGKCWRRALELKSDLVVAQGNLATLMTREGRVAEAQACYQKAAALEPQQAIWRLRSAALCPTVFDTNEQIEEYRHTLLESLLALGRERPKFDVAALIAGNCTPSFNLQFHGRNNRTIRATYARLFRDCFANEEPPLAATGRPRLGFVVTDSHEGGFLKSMGGTLDRMDPDAFELLIFGSRRGAARICAALRNRAIRAEPISPNFERAATTLRAARCDVIYHWEVGTDGTNYYLPFRWLAPVQCTAWGFQDTSGIPRMTHYLSSSLIEPAEASGHYSERLVLANTLLSFQHRLATPKLSKPREMFGIAAEQHLYLCAQQTGKFQPDFDPLLAEILRRDPAGVIVITENIHGQFVAEQLRRRLAMTMGDVADRVVFLPAQPHPDYLSLVAAADVLLDPLHFAGGNSTYDGLSLNKPIVTLPFDFARGRYTLACYKKMGMDDCVASTSQEYVEMAVALGTDPALRSRVEAKIRETSGAIFEDAGAVNEHVRIFSELVELARSGVCLDLLPPNF